MDHILRRPRHAEPVSYTHLIEKLEDGRWMIHSEEAIHGVAPGQFCVVYEYRKNE